jgi:hypothetical protein
MPLNDLFMDTRKWQFDTGWEKLIKKGRREERIYLAIPITHVYIRTYKKKFENKEILRADHIDIDYLILYTYVFHFYGHTYI